MTVAQFQQSNFNTDQPSAYKGKIDGNFSVLGQTAAMFAPHQSAPNMTITVDAGSMMVNGTLVAQGQQVSSTITAPTTNPRIDRAVINVSSGALLIVTGTPAASPVPPAIPSGYIPCAQILLQTTSSSIINSMITDERTFLSPAQSYIPNIAHNGDGRVAQRPSTAFSANTQIYGQCDRWLVGALATTQTAGTIDQGTMTGIDGVTRTCVQATGFTLTGVSAEIFFMQRMESRDTINLNNQTITVQAEVLQSTGAAVSYVFQIYSATMTDNFSATTNFSQSTGISVPSGVTTQISYTFPIGASQASNGIQVAIGVACGPVTSQTFKITNFKVAISGGVTPYNNSGRSYQQELALCQRYLPVLADGRAPSTGSPTIGVTNSLATNATVVFGLYSNQPRLPVTSWLPGGAFTLTDTAGTSHAVTLISGSGFGNGNSVALNFSATGLTASQPVIFQPGNGAYLLGLGAEL